MPWNGSAPTQTFGRTDGTRSGDTTWQLADAAGVDIVADDHDTHDTDVADGLNLALKKDGGNTATADIPMGDNKFTGLGDAEARTEALTYGQAQDNKHSYMATVGGTADVITLTSASGLAITAYAAGQVFYFKAASSNTGSVTVNIDGVGAKTVKRFDGSTDLMADDIRSGSVVQIKYDGTNFQLDGATQSGASSDILARVVPTGATLFWGLDTIPAGWLKADGQAVTKSSYPELDAVYQADGYPYGASSATLGVGTMNLPPAAGRFIRVVDEGAGTDPDAASRTDRGDGTTGDNVGTLQGDENKSHTHTGTTDGHQHFVKVVKDDITIGGGTSHVRNIDTTGGAGGSGNSKTESATDTFTSDSTGGNESRPKNIYQYLIVLANPTAAAASSVGLFGLPYNFDSATTDADPGSGNLRLDNATLASVTTIYLDNLEANAADVSAFIDTWDDSGSTVKGTVKISKVGAPSNYAIYSVTGSVTDGAGYRKVAVTHVGSNGSFAAADPISVEFVRTGDKGDSGDVGFPFAFDTSTTTTSDPGAGDVRLNNATLASVTEIAVSDTTTATGNPDVSAYLLTWDDSDSVIRGTITIQKASARENFAIYDINGASTDESGWVRFAVVHVDSAGSFSNTDAINVSFIRAGDKGAAAGAKWTWDTTTTMADPGTGDVRLNNGTLSSVTAMAISASSAETGNPDLSAWIAAWDDVGNAGANGQVIIKKISAPENVAFFDVGSVTDNSTWLQVGLTYVSHAGSFSASDALSVQFSPAGADGGGAGDVTAASSFGTDNRVVRSDGTGKGVQASGISIDDSDNISGITNVTGADANLVSGTAGANGRAAQWNTDGDLVDAGFAASDIYRSGGTDVAVTDGGTGASTLTDGGILLGSGTGAITAMAVLADGAIVVGDGTTDPVPLTAFSSSTGNLLAAKGGSIGQQTIWVPAGAMVPTTTAGATYTETELATNDVMVAAMHFDTASDEKAQFGIQMPKGWDEGTVVAQVVWSHPSTTTNFDVTFALRAVAFADGDAGDAAFGTAQTMKDTGGTTDDIYISPESAAITIAGSPSPEEYVVFELYRDVDGAGTAGDDDLAVDARVHGVKIHYTLSAATDD